MLTGPALCTAISPTLPAAPVEPFVTPVMFGVVIVGDENSVVRQEKPVPDVYCRTLAVALQLGSANAAGAAAELVALATTVLAEIDASPERPTLPHPAGVDGPVETIV